MASSAGSTSLLIRDSAFIKPSRHVCSLQSCWESQMSAAEGKLDDLGKERIEEQVAIFIRSSTANIRKLEALIQQHANLSPQVSAYQHGVVSSTGFPVKSVQMQVHTLHAVAHHK